MNSRHDIEAIFSAARAIADPAERAKYLDTACGGDGALRARVERLLAAEVAAGGFLDGLTPGLAETQMATPPCGLVPTSAPLVEQVGMVIDRFKLLQQIGEGGFGVVYMAEQEHPVRRKVALKIIKLGMDTKQVIARFEAERQALAIMDHPHIAKILDAGATATGRPYFVMELVKGVPITEYCDQNRVPLRERLALFAQVCSAVQHAHQKGIIHRDIKPSNILVTMHDGKPVPKVIDFGIAKATQQRLTERTLFTEFGQFIGTPAYMSPEQAEMSELDIDTRSDIYSLGVLLYELLTGTTPFDKKALRGAALDEIKRIIREDEPPKPSTRLSTMLHDLPSIAASRMTEPARLTKLVRGDLDWVVMKCLEKERGRRYETANGLAMDIDRYLSGDPVVAAPPSRTYRVRKFIRRHKRPVAAAVMFVALLVAGLAATSLTARWALREKAVAIAAREAERRAREAEQSSNEDARRQAEIARAVNDFLTNDLLSAVNPTRTPNRQITVREVLDEAAQRVGHRFEAAPLIGASIEQILGELYVRLDELASGRKHLQRACDLYRKLLGERDRATLHARASLDDLYFKTGRYEEGIRAVEESIALMESALGADDPVTMASRNQLATLFTQRRQYDRAEQLFRDTWERQKRVLGASHRETVGTLNNFARLYMEQQRFDLAEPLLTEALTALRATVGQEDPDAMEVAFNLGWTYQELGRAQEAEQMTAQMLETARRVLGDDHQVTQLGVNNLGVIYNRSGRPELAEPLYREGLEVSRRTLGPDHPDLVPSINNLGKLYSQLKQFDRAEPLLAEAVEKARRLLAKGDFKAGAAIQVYGECLLELNRPAEAIPLLLEANDILLPILGPDHAGLRRLRRALASAYERVGDSTSAAKWKPDSGPGGPATRPTP